MLNPSLVSPSLVSRPFANLSFANRQWRRFELAHRGSSVKPAVKINQIAQIALVGLNGLNGLIGLITRMGIEIFLGFLRLFTGVQCRYLGAPPDERNRTIFFANHTSHVDCMVLLSVLPSSVRYKTRPVAASDYWAANPVRRWIAHNILNSILIPRAKITRQNYPVKELAAALDQGHCLILFPEGGRSDGSSIRDFKSGLFHIAKARSDVDLVPVHIDNTNRILPKGEFLPVPLSCSITIGTPLRLLPNETRSDFLERMRRHLEHVQDR